MSTENDNDSGGCLGTIIILVIVFAVIANIIDWRNLKNRQKELTQSIEEIEIESKPYKKKKDFLDSIDYIIRKNSNLDNDIDYLHKRKGELEIEVQKNFDTILK